MSDETTGGGDTFVLNPDLPFVKFIELAPPGVTSGLVISAGEIVAVEAGSVLSAATVQSGGALEIISGGQDFGTTVQSGGFDYVLFDGVANGTVIENGGAQLVSSGGIASGSVVSGGVLYINDPGTAVNETVVAGGIVEAFPATTFLDFGPEGGAPDPYVQSGVTVDVASGGVLSFGDILSGGLEQVFAGGQVDGITISGGQLLVSSGGSVDSVAFQGTGGAVSVDDAGELSGPIVGWQIGDTLDFRNLVLSNVVETGLPLSSNGELSFAVHGQTYAYSLSDVQSGTEITSQGDGSGGTLLGLTTDPDYVGFGQSLYVSAGETRTNLLVIDGGFVGVLFGGIANQTTIDSFGAETVSAGGGATGTTVGEAGKLVVDRGATATDSLVESGGLEDGYGNINGTIISSGGTILLPWASGETAATLAADKGATLEDGAILGIDIQTGLTVSGLIVPDGVFAQVEGTTVSTILDNDGREITESGGLTSAATASSGGTETVSSGGAAQGTIVDGGNLVVFYGGTAIGAIIHGGSATIFGTASGTTINSGGTLYDDGSLPTLIGGAAMATVVSSGGTEDIRDVAVANNTTVLDGGVEIVDYAGTAISTLVEAGAEQQVDSDGSAVSATIYGKTVLSGGEDFFDAAITSGALIEAGGSEIVSSGGRASGSLVESGGVLDIEGGYAVGAVVSNGGSLLLNGGFIISTIVLDGVTIDVGSGGNADETMISNGGEVAVRSGSTAGGTTILGGGRLFVSAGAVASQTVVSSGGEMVVTSGGTIDWETTIAGGLVVLDAGAVVGPVGTFTFAGSGGVFEIDGTTLPTPPHWISGFVPGDTIDLAGIAFAKGGTAIYDSATDLLQIVEKGVTYDLPLAGEPVGYTFQLTRDQNGGTEITAVAADFWQGPSSSNRSGDWSTAADWGNQHIPQNLDRIVFGGAGAYTVTSTKNRKVAGLAITDTGAILDVISGTLTLSHQSRNEGAIEIAHGGSIVDDAGLVNDGMLAINGGQLTVSGTLTGTGNAAIDGGILDFASKVAATETVSFASTATGTLELGTAQKFASTVAGFAQGDVIDLENFAFSQATITRVSGSGNAGTDTIVTIKAGTLTAKIALLNQFAGQFAIDASDYTLSSDKRGTTPGTLLELAAPHSV